MKNIYIFDEVVSSAKNGIGTFMKNLLSSFDIEEYTLNILCFDSSDAEFSIVKDENIEKLLFPQFNSGFFTENGKSITRLMCKYIKDSENNIFIVNHSPCHKLLSSIKEVYPQSKIIFIIHDLSWTSYCLGDLNILNNKINDDDKKLIEYIADEKQIFDMSNKVICLSESTSRVLADVYKVNSDHISVIPNGLNHSIVKVSNFDKTRLREELNINDKSKIILYVGRATKPKGYLALVTAFEKLVGANSQARLVIAGSSYVETGIPSYVSTRITFLGHIAKEELNKWYSIADIGVIPSYSEQCSYVGIEMLANGLPIVVSDGFGLTDMFNNANSYVAEIGARADKEFYINNLFNGMLALISDPKMSKELSINARKTFEEKYTFEHMRKLYIECVNNL